MSEQLEIKRRGHRKYRNVAQLVRASPRQGEGRRFESDHSYHSYSIYNKEKVKSDVFI